MNYLNSDKVQFVDEDEQPNSSSLNATQDSIEQRRNPSDRRTRVIDHENQRYPYCIVWTSLPCITQCLPVIGHTGIAG